MTEEAKGPVDNSHKDPAYAAQATEQNQENRQESADTEENEGGEQNTSEQSAATENESAPQKPRGVQKRLDELTREKHEARREAEHWREMAMRQQPQQPAQPAPQAKQESSDEPVIEDFDFDMAAYTKAYIKWEKAQDQKAAQQQKAEQEKADRQKKFQDSALKFSESAPDFAELVFHNPNLPITEVMVDVMTEADNPAEVAYYLAKNPEEAARIAAMSPAGVGRAIGRIESSLSAPESTRQPVQKTVTQAPPPPTTLSGAKAPSKKLEEMSMAEYAAHRAEERKAKGLRP